MEKNCDGRVEGIPIDSVRLWGRRRETAVWTKAEDGCVKEGRAGKRQWRSGLLPGIDNLDVKSYIRCVCLAVTY